MRNLSLAGTSGVQRPSSEVHGSLHHIATRGFRFTKPIAVVWSASRQPSTRKRLPRMTSASPVTRPHHIARPAGDQPATWFTAGVLLVVGGLALLASRDHGGVARGGRDAALDRHRRHDRRHLPAPRAPGGRAGTRRVADARATAPTYDSASDTSGRTQAGRPPVVAPRSGDGRAGDGVLRRGRGIVDQQLRDGDHLELALAQPAHDQRAAPWTSRSGRRRRRAGG